MDAILSHENAADIVFMLLATALAVVLLEVVRTFLVTRRTEVRVADEALKRHFEALTLVVNDGMVTASVKQFVLKFSAAVCQQRVAKRIAESIKTGRKPNLSPDVRAHIEEVKEELRLLMRSREDMATSLVEVVNFGFASMVLRWPETEITIARTLMLDAEAPVTRSFERKAECVMAQIPSGEFSPQFPALQPA